MDAQQQSVQLVRLFLYMFSLIALRKKKKKKMFVGVSPTPLCNHLKEHSGTQRHSKCCLTGPHDKGKCFPLEIRWIWGHLHKGRRGNDVLLLALLAPVRYSTCAWSLERHFTMSHFKRRMSPEYMHICLRTWNNKCNSWNVDQSNVILTGSPKKHPIHQEWKGLQNTHTSSTSCILNVHILEREDRCCERGVKRQFTLT